MDSLSSHMHRPHIESLKGGKMRLGVGSEAPNGVKVGGICICEPKITIVSYVKVFVLLVYRF